MDNELPARDLVAQRTSQNQNHGNQSNWLYNQTGYSETMYIVYIMYIAEILYIVGTIVLSISVMYCIPSYHQYYSISSTREYMLYCVICKKLGDENYHIDIKI